MSEIIMMIIELVFVVEFVVRVPYTQLSINKRPPPFTLCMDAIHTK